jgi:predicted Zn-dependent peptidase
LNNKTRYAAQRLFEEMFPGHPIGVPDTGTEEEISSVTPSKCVEEGMRIVREGEADIFVLAPCTASRAERLVRRAFVIPPRAFERFRLENLGEVRRPHRTVREQMDVAQAKLALGFRLVRWRPGEARYVAALADTVLGSGPASKLFRNVRECRSLCYDVRSHLDAVTGTLTIGAGIDPRSFGPAVQAIQDEVLAMAKGRITEDEVGTARASILSALEEVEDTQSGLADFFYIRRLLGRPERSLSEVAAGVVKTQAGRIPKLMARAALDTVFFLDRGGQMSASDGAS